MGDPSANNSQEGDFKKVETLGSGCFGSVDLCTVEEGKTYAERGDRVAVKRFFSIAEAEMAKKEVKILNRLKKHRYIVAYLDHFRDSKGQLAIVMEYCDQGTLGGFLSSRTTLLRPLPEFEIWRLVWQFSTALEFLHGQHPPIIHNDLKPANILKIADFGVCNVLGKSSQHPWCLMYLAFLSSQDPLRHVLPRRPWWWDCLLPGSRGSQRR